MKAFQQRINVGVVIYRNFVDCQKSNEKKLKWSEVKFINSKKISAVTTTKALLTNNKCMRDEK